MPDTKTLPDMQSFRKAADIMLKYQDITKLDFKDLANDIKTLSNDGLELKLKMIICAELNERYEAKIKQAIAGVVGTDDFQVKAG